MRGDWESWLLPLSLFWMWWEPTPGGRWGRGRERGLPHSHTRYTTGAWPLRGKGLLWTWGA